MIKLGPGCARANFVYFQFLASKKLAKISQVPNFGGGRIKPTCFNQNFADRHIHHKIYIQQNVSRVNRAMDFSTLHILDSPLSSNGDFRALIGRVVALGLLAFVLLLAPLAIEGDCLAGTISSNCCQ